MPEKIVRIPFGGDPDRVERNSRRDDDLFRVLFVGGIGLRKGVRYLLEAWHRLRLRDAELVLVGGTDAWGDRLRTQYGRIARWEGQVMSRAVDRWFAAADVFAFPSLAEGSAIVNYEALAAAVPVITTPNAGSVVRDGIDGFIVPARDVDALCDRLRFLYDHRGEARAMGERGREEIRASYTWRHYRQRIAELYRGLPEERA